MINRILKLMIKEGLSTLKNGSLKHNEDLLCMYKMISKSSTEYLCKKDILSFFL
jgi:hypothetical protein